MNKINNKGVSLIEILVVIALAAIVTGVTVFSIQTVNNGDVTKAARNYASAVDLARNTSMAKGKNRGSLNVVLENNRWYYYIGDGNSSNKTEICKANRIKVRNGSAVELTTGFTVKFNVAGMAVENPVPTVEFKNNNRSCKVNIHSLTGKQEVTYKP